MPLTTFAGSIKKALKENYRFYLPSGIPPSVFDSLPLRDCYFSEDGGKLAFVQFAGREVFLLYLSRWIEGDRFVLRVLLHELSRRGTLYAQVFERNVRMNRILQKLGRKTASFRVRASVYSVPHFPELHRPGTVTLDGKRFSYNGLFVSGEEENGYYACRYFCCPYYVQTGASRGEKVNLYVIDGEKVEKWLKKLGESQWGKRYDFHYEERRRRTEEI